MKKVAVFNQKGGCAKTTTVVDVAGCLSNRGYKVLVVDCDPQMNSGGTLLMEQPPEDRIPYDVTDVIKGLDIQQAIQPAPIKKRGNAAKYVGISVIQSSRNLASLAVDSFYSMRDAIASVSSLYDYVLFDCPPYLSDFTVNILVAADYVLVPATVDKDSLAGYGQLLDCVQLLREQHLNPDIKILGVFLTMVMARESFDRYMYDTVSQMLQDEFISVTIRRQTLAKQASHFGRPLCYFRPTSPVAQDYERLTDALLVRMGEKHD